MILRAIAHCIVSALIGCEFTHRKSRVNHFRSYRVRRFCLYRSAGVVAEAVVG